jgi:hypothetical protein
MTTEITLTSGEKVKAIQIDSNQYRLPGGRVVRTWTDEDGTIYQDSESDE